MLMNLAMRVGARTAERQDAARTTAPAATRIAAPSNSPPVDLEDALDAAAARLNEAWVRPDETGHWVKSGLALEFAATLCAYGLIEQELERTRARREPDPDPAETPAPPKKATPNKKRWPDAAQPVMLVAAQPQPAAAAAGWL